jgi:subtilisin family serine protease
MLFTNSNGYVVSEVPRRGITRCAVTPIDGHWSYQFMGPFFGQELVCESTGFEICQSWWAILTGLDTRKGRAITPLKVGIIDLPFLPAFENSNITVVDKEGHPIKLAGTGSHGYQVTKIINESINDNAEHELILVDAADEDEPDKLDLSKIASGIYTLVDEFGVDAINISGGIYLDANDALLVADLSQLQDAVDYAQDRGVIVIAAAGNDQSQGVAAPACFTNVIGVGSIGIASVAPVHSICHGKEIRASASSGSFGETKEGARVFSDIDSSFGKQINAVAPGVSVGLTFTNGDCIECFGTSYAAPIVTSVLALSLSQNEHFRQVKLTDRFSYLWKHLKSLCEDLGMRQVF